MCVTNRQKTKLKRTYRMLRPATRSMTVIDMVEKKVIAFPDGNWAKWIWPGASHSGIGCLAAGSRGGASTPPPVGVWSRHNTATLTGREAQFDA